MSDDNWDAFINYASEDGLAYALELKEQFEHEKYGFENIDFVEFKLYCFD